MDTHDWLSTIKETYPNNDKKWPKLSHQINNVNWSKSIRWSKIISIPTNSMGAGYWTLGNWNNFVKIVVIEIVLVADVVKTKTLATKYFRLNYFSRWNYDESICFQSPNVHGANWVRNVFSPCLTYWMKLMCLNKCWCDNWHKMGVPHHFWQPYLNCNTVLASYKTTTPFTPKLMNLITRLD
jgi:hypothetical protein